MAKDRNTFLKMQREMEKKRKAEQKRARRKKKKEGAEEEANGANQPEAADSPATEQ